MHVNYFRACTTLVVFGFLAACGEKTVAPTPIAPGPPAHTATDPFNDAGNCLATDFALVKSCPDLSDPTKSCTAGEIGVAQSTRVKPGA